MNNEHHGRRSPIDTAVGFCLRNRLAVFLILIVVVAFGLRFAPFDWQIPGFPRDPVPVDAIPDIGENQQIVFTEWAGRSPRDVEDQVTDPLTSVLLGIPGVKTVRGLSMFGFSTIYLIFREDAGFYWSRSRILEKLSGLPAGVLPDGVRPTLGPDATALGQVFWYTLEGQDEDGNPTGGWDLDELRSIQDWLVRFKLMSAGGVSEVASVGGFVREYQVDVDPDAMRAYDTRLSEVFRAVRESNADVGARSIEVNKVEYVIRGIGFIRSLEDIENAVVKVNHNVPVYVRNVAKVGLGPALRRGALDKEGAEAVGGVVVVRFGENPLEAIKNVKKRIEEISPGLPRKTLPDGTVSQVRIVPFYDRTQLIHETLGTLSTALSQEVLVTIVVVMIMLMHLRSSVLVSALLPLAILACFIAMKVFGVDANIVALSGIAIAIGTMVDMGIVVSENILRHLDRASPDEPRLAVVHRATGEVGSAVLTAVMTTVVSFLPVFLMSGAEGKLFKPLAFTKTFALMTSLVISLTVLPVFAGIMLLGRRASSPAPKRSGRSGTFVLVACMLLLLSRYWLPLGPEKGQLRNLVFVSGLIGGLLLLFYGFQRFYEPVLHWCLAHKPHFLAVPLAIVVLGIMVWRGLGREFMPSLDEGAYLYMPSASPHASIGGVLEILQIQDGAISRIPEVESVVGKLGRVESALDPAPVPMIETIVTYKPEYTSDGNGKRVRQWRDRIKMPEDIWDEIIKAAHMPGITKPEKLQPISARLVMLQSGIRGSMAVKIQGSTQGDIEQTALQIERLLRSGQIAGLDPAIVNIDRSSGNWKPYLEIVPDRTAIARYGMRLRDVHDVIEVAIGGKTVTTTVENRQRYPVRVRYMRELRDSIESLGRILVPAPDGAQIPLVQLAQIRFASGPQAIKTEDTSLVGYVFFGKKRGFAEVDVVENVKGYLNEQIASGRLPLGAGVTLSFAGTYESQVRARSTLMWALPLTLVIILLILHFQFRAVSTSLLVFSGVAVAWAGGFVVIWMYGQPWFLDFHLFGISMRELFQVHAINLSVAVWVGFLALFGIATDDGVIMATYLDQSFASRKPATKEAVRAAVAFAGMQRVRPCLMTTATTVLALIPVLTSTGRGADIMVPMAIPVFGGMIFELITMFVVPVLYCAIAERRVRAQ